MDYLPLIENVRNRISKWTVRALSFAGRLQLVRSVIFSVTNFWIADFRLPKACIQEIDKLCSAFLWSGPSLNPRKAKVAWKDVCLPKEEGGLGLRSIEEANKVCCLKLIWKLISSKNSLWVNWVTEYLIRRGSFWAVQRSTNSGSWMWRKLLKYRDLAKQFYMVEVKGGNNTSFWFDHWSDLGCLFDRVGDRGPIQLGINRLATVGEVLDRHRRRRHRQTIYTDIEYEILKIRQQREEGVDDVVKWKSHSGQWQPKFVSRDTWDHIRIVRPKVNWYRGVWFSQATPKYSFMATVYSIWRERNNRKHGEKALTVFRMVRMIDKLVKNQICSIRNNGVRKYEDGLEIWFASR
ncbi:uncharacterized protein LOC112088476 [Eutrema salsugineum]|uniref:uncharacterized protein LOC112088476 n=1 Tax=Eutrema salsugineum TaxID=72664 RepID=UPI000CED384B|nr:uncharacterized protein LOC112088476 [Eutrema salsugineum]